jgi:hypothetical protein
VKKYALMSKSKGASQVKARGLRRLAPALQLIRYEKKQAVKG